MKIAIIGNPGSGKSSLGLKLHNILNIPLYHLDQYFWKPGWQKIDSEEFEKKHHQLCDQDNWIIEGVATRLFPYRAEKADIIIFLDYPTYLCLYRVFKRALTHFGKVFFSSAPGCYERYPDLTLLRYIWNFNSEKKPAIEALLKKFQDQKKVFIVKNKAELDQLIKIFESSIS